MILIYEEWPRHLTDNPEDNSARMMYADWTADHEAQEQEITRLRKETVADRVVKFITDADALETRCRELETALVKAAEPLEALALAVRWELADEVKDAIHGTIKAIHAALRPPKPKEERTHG